MIWAFAVVMAAGQPGPTGVPDHVRAVMTRETDSYDVSAAVDELSALGPEALPLITAELPGCGPGALASAAIVLSRADYRPAAGPLARRLRDAGRFEFASGAEQPDLAVLRALGRIGTAAEVDAVAEVARKGGRSGLQALATLVKIDVPEARAAAVATFPSFQDWRVSWSPPSAPQEPHRQGGVARVALASGASLVVFQDGRLGGRRDLWMAEVSADGQPAPAVFLGRQVPFKKRTCVWECPIAVVLKDRKLTVRNAETGVRVLVDLDAVSRDSDQDGLTDLVERRLGTNPGRADSDRDGIPDGQDPVPSSAARAPQGEQEQIAEAVFEHLSFFEEDLSSAFELLALVGQPPLPWSGRTGPVLLGEAALKGAKRRGAEYLGRLSIEPMSAVSLSEYLTRYSLPGLRDDERAYDVRLERGEDGLDVASGFGLIVRRVAGRWLIRDVTRTWTVN